MIASWCNDPSTVVSSTIELSMKFFASAGPFSGLVITIWLCVTGGHGFSATENDKQLTLQHLQMMQPLEGLPSNDNVTLRHVGLGVGIQNYSCASMTATPTRIGAIASVFDITSYSLSHGIKASTDLGVAYYKAYVKLPCQASQNLDDNTCQMKANSNGLQHLGHHWFQLVNSVGVPYFSIPGDNLSLVSAQKVGDVAAPTDAYGGGKTGHGAVDWLLLTRDGSPANVGPFTEIYRILTCGGKPDPNGCSSGMEILSYKYTALYWYFV